jgi:nuclear inhibitor of protein phosphatase 1
MYMLREKPKAAPRPIIEELEQSAEDSEGGLLGLPETETELDVILSQKNLFSH